MAFDGGHIVAIGGGGFLDQRDAALVDLAFSLARRPQPRICLIPTASGDPAERIVAFYRRMAAWPCHPADLTLFPRTVADLRSFVLAQDVIYVSGGSTANLLAVWRVHGLDEILREALAAGVVLAGMSAGMNCWFEACTTDSFDVSVLHPLRDGLGFLPGSSCSHYDTEPQRRPTYHRLIGDGSLPDGVAAEDGVALHFHGGRLVEAVSSRPGARAFRCQRVDGRVVEDPIPTRFIALTG
jgi:dipeptidase E